MKPSSSSFDVQSINASIEFSPERKGTFGFWRSFVFVVMIESRVVISSRTVVAGNSKGAKVRYGSDESFKLNEDTVAERRIISPV